MIKILRTMDAGLLGILNHDVQEIHHEIEPGIFKAHSKEAMDALFQEYLKDENMSAYIAYDDEMPVGYILLEIKHSKETFFKYSYKALVIDQICIEAAYKGKGFGKALVDLAKDIAREENIKRIEMNYWTENKASGEFFRSQGFENYNERLAFTLK
ncbi:MAG: GNAT family N-acetyltransferase [Clostridia bacterium]|nr:GNAT family N-acetyltransferase [Clostridia bacterium]